MLIPVNPNTQNLFKVTNHTLSGFSLIELLIVLAIISALLILSYPSYHHHMIQSRRNEAKIGLFAFASKLENYKTLNNSYQGATLALIGMPQETDDQSYQFIFKDLQDTRYELEAVPQGSQARADPSCGSLGLNEAGTKTITGPGPIANCW